MKKLILLTLSSFLAIGVRAATANDSVSLTIGDRKSNQVEWGATVGSVGVASSGETAPFWSVNGQGGRRSIMPLSGALSLATSATYRFAQDHSLTAQIELVGRTGIDPFYLIHTLGVTYRFKSLELKLGALPYHHPTEHSSLSSGDMLLSDNAAPIPMAMIATKGFRKLPFTHDYLSFYTDFSVGRFFENNFLERNVANKSKGVYTTDILWHHKSFYLKIGNESAPFPLTLTLGGIHAAQWGGERYGYDQPNPAGFKNFIKVVLGRSGGDDASVSDQINVLGNHFGYYLVQLDYKRPNYTLQAYHEHFFEDKSGMEWSNGFDGLYGFKVSLPRQRYLNEFLIEYLTTTNQSGPFHIIDFERHNGEGRGGGADNYYNNSEYPTGVSYFGMGLGTPLVKAPLYNNLDSYEPGFRRNRVKALHFGMKGALSTNIDYALRLTGLHARARFQNTFTKPINSFYSHLRVNYRPSSLPAWAFGAELGADFGQVTPATIGGALSVSYHFDLLSR